MTQQQLISTLLTLPKTVKQLFEESGLLRPNIRRILHHGTKEGKYTRLGRGVYMYNNFGKSELYVVHGDATSTLKKLQGKMVFDAVFLDIPYYSYQLIGRNRRKIKDQYEFILPKEFAQVITSLKHMLAHGGKIHLMLSGAKSAQPDMKKYLYAMQGSGLYLCNVTEYHKLYKNGKPTINIRGLRAAPEIVYTFSTELSSWTIKHFEAVRPKGYNTEKPLSLIENILAGARRILDPFAGSGVVGEYALLNDAMCVLIEKSETAVYKFILPRLNKVFGRMVL